MEKFNKGFKVRTVGMEMVHVMDYREAIELAREYGQETIWSCTFKVEVETEGGDVECTE